MNLSNLRPAKGSVRERKRVGRGQGSGMGGTSTRGHKGAQSRSGYSRKVHFEGGQMPLQRRVPKFGFKNINRVEYKPLNLDAIQALVDETKATIVDMDFLLQHGLVSKKDLVKVLSRGELTTAIEIHAHAFSASAKDAIEKAGGKAIVPTREAKEEAAK
ncbi:50S ribosomal protein L15 [Spirosoma migulaei]